MGPCLCGDAYCPHCGSPYAAEVEAAELWLSETLSKAKLTPEEYRIVAAVGLAAVMQSRTAAKRAVAEERANVAEAAALSQEGNRW